MDANQTLERMRSALSKAMPLPADIAKSWTQSGSATTGLTYYDLQAPALTIYPVLTPLRNMIPRVGKRGAAGIQANWKAITGINTSNVRAGVSEGNRGGVISHTFQEYLAAYRGMGLEDFVTFEAEYAAEGFDDADARSVEGTLRGLMIAEESMLLGGDTSVLLGTTPTPTLVGSTTGGTLPTETLSVIVVALGFRAFWELAGYNNGATGSSLGLTIDPNSISVVTKTNADGSTDTYNGGVAQKSTAATASITGATGSCTATVAPVPGAVAYAWYWNTGGTEQLGAITTINSVVITANSASAIAASGANLAADHSTSALDFDGLLYQALKSGSGAYVSAQATGTAGVGTKLTGNGAGGITEIDKMNQDRWNLYRLSMNELWANSQEMLNINAIVIANGGAPLIRFGMDGGGQLEAGITIGSILNTITGEKMALKVHPNMPPGMLMARCNQLPYKLSGITDVVRVLTRQEYYQVAWPVVKRRREYGVYVDEVLQNYFPPAIGIIYNIPNAH